VKIEITSDGQTVLEMATKKTAVPGFYERYKDLIHLLLGFLLTGLIGALLTQRLDESNTSRQREFESRKEAIAGSTAFFKELSVLLDGRRWESRQMIFEMHKFVDNYDLNASQAQKEAQLAQLKSAYTIYYKSVSNYNASLNWTRVLIFKYFSKKAELDFYGENDKSGTTNDPNKESITGGFMVLHKLIRESYAQLLVGEETQDSNGKPWWSSIKQAGGEQYTSAMTVASNKMFDKIYRFYNRIRNCMINRRNTSDPVVCNQ
jgi:hypothetical protein